jgi:hypothetical protein
MQGELEFVTHLIPEDDREEEAWRVMSGFIKVLHTTTEDREEEAWRVMSGFIKVRIERRRRGG